MPKITFREFLEIESKDKEDFSLIPLKDDRTDEKLMSIVHSFLSKSEKEIVDKINNSRISVLVDNVIKEPDVWAYTYVSKDSEIILTPQFGKGKMGILFALAIIAAGVTVLAAPGVIGLEAGALATQMGTSLIMGGVGLFMQTVLAPSLPNLAESNDQETKTYSWSGITSLSRIGVPIPVLIGTHKIGGDIIGAYTKPINNENYLYMLLLISEGEIEGICQAYDHTEVCTTSDPSSESYKVPAIELNGQVIDKYTGVRWWARNGTNTENSGLGKYDVSVQNPIPHFSESRLQYNDGREVHDSTGIIFTTRSKVDIAEIQLVCPSLYKTYSSGASVSLIPASVDYKIEYKKINEFTWTTYHPSGLTATYMCTNFSFNDNWGANCLLGGSASLNNCNSENKICSFATSKYNDAYMGSVKFNIGYAGMGVDKVFGMDQIANRKVKLALVSRKENINYIMREGVMVESGPRSLSLKWHLSTPSSSSYFTKTITQQTLETLTGTEYRYPSEGTFTVLDYLITISGIYSVPVYINDDSLPERRLGEFNIYALPFISPSEYGTITSSGTRNPTYAYERIYLPSYDRYDLRVSRKGVTSESVELSDQLTLQAVTEVFGDQLIYPNTALLGLEIKATSALSGQMPNVTLYAKGVKVDVPNVNTGSFKFDDVYWDGTSTYGTVGGNPVSVGLGTSWEDSTFSQEYTENFAAHLKNIITNERYGTGRYIHDCDLNFDSWLEILGEAHTRYNPWQITTDYVGWNCQWDTAWFRNVHLFDEGSVFTDRIMVWHSNDFWWNDGTSVPGEGFGYWADEITEVHFGSLDGTNRKVHVEYPSDYDVKYDENYPYPTVLKFCFRLQLDTFLRSAWLYNLDISVANLNTTQNLYLRVTTLNFEMRPPRYFGDVGHYYVEGETLYEDGVTVSGNKISVSLDTMHRSTADLKIELTRSDAVPIYDPSDYPDEPTKYLTGHLVGDITEVNITSVYSGSDHFHTANGVIERTQNAMSFFGEFCYSFRYFLVDYGKTIAFKIDKDETPVQKISSTEIVEGSFSQSLAKLSDIPYILNTQFADVTRDYELNTRSGIVSVAEANQSSTKTIGLKYITDPEKLERELRYKIKQYEEVYLTISFKTNIEFIHLVSGDLFYFEHPLPVWGTGKDGRIIDYSSGTNEITLDKEYEFDSSSSYYILYQNTNNDLVTASLTNSDSTTDVVTLSSWDSDPIQDSSYVVAPSTSVHVFRMISMSRDKDENINCVAINHGGVYDLSDASILEPPNHGEEYPTNNSITVLGLRVEFSRGTGSSGTFTFSVDVASSFSTKTYISYSVNQTGPYTNVATIEEFTNFATWTMNDVTSGKTYYFRAISTSGSTVSDPFITSYFVSSAYTTLSAPTGLRIFGIDPLTSTFNTKDLVVIWNGLEGSNIRYLIRIWKNSEIEDNFLVKDREVSGTTFTYSLADNISDNDGTPATDLIIRVASFVSSSGVNDVSDYSAKLEAINTVPPDVSGVTASTSVGGVNFSWTQSTEEDHQCYYIRTKVSTGSWSNWFENDSNGYVYQLSDSEISSYGTNPTIYIEVKDRDWYDQDSENASGTSGTANAVRDSIFAMEITAEDGTGSLSALVDGNLTSGGWTI